MGEKVEIVSENTIKPSSPTPHHLQHFKLSFLDQLAPSFYVPILLFYSASDVRTFASGLSAVSEKLKTSLSEVLTLYYPFCGRLRGNSIIECNDEGVLFIDSKLPIELSNILKTPQLHNIYELLPCAPYNPRPQQRDTSRIMAVQLNQFKCGGITLGVCFSHKLVDASTAASFLNAWAATSRGHGNISNFVPPPTDDAALLFPPRNISIDMIGGMLGHEKIVTKRFIFSGSNISRLRQNIGCSNFNPSRVEAVTALIWKSSLVAAKESSECEEEKLHASMISHLVNIRNRMVPALSKHSIGNLWQYAVSSLVEVEGEVGLRDLAERLRKTIGKVDGNYISKLQGDEFVEVVHGIKELRTMAEKKGVKAYAFSSWVGFEFYEVDFGWGKPTYVRTISVPIENLGMLMRTKDGDGIEAWITLTTREMAQLEHNAELLDFASSDS